MTTSILAQTATNQASGAFFGFGFLFLALGLLLTVLWVYALINAATRSDLETTERILWIVLLLFVPGLGLILYFLLKGRGR